MKSYRINFFVSFLIGHLLNPPINFDVSDLFYLKKYTVQNCFEFNIQNTWNFGIQIHLKVGGKWFEMHCNVESFIQSCYNIAEHRPRQKIWLSRLDKLFYTTIERPCILVSKILNTITLPYNYSSLVKMSLWWFLTVIGGHWRSKVQNQFPLNT